MQPFTLLIVLLCITTVAYYLAKRRSLSVSAGIGGIRQLHSLPSYYGSLAVMWCAVPAIVVLSLWLALENSVVTSMVVAELPEEMRALPKAELNLKVNDIKNLVTGNIVAGDPDPATQAAADRYRSLQSISKAALTVIVLVLAIAGTSNGWRIVSPRLRARNYVETGIKFFLIASSTVAIFTTIGIVLSVLFEAIRFFQAVSFTEFVFGLDWSPQTAIREDQVGSSGAFGAIPLFAGTLLISFIAMLVAVPVGLLSAIYLAEYAGPRVRAVGKPVLEILAGIPTVVYGFFAALTVAPFLRDTGSIIGFGCVFRERAGGGRRHGHHDHPVCVLAFRRRDQRGTAVTAGRFLRSGCDAVRNHQAGDSACGVARYCRWHSARRVSCHRRDHDRSDGGGSGGESHSKSTASGYHRYGADRDATGWRPGVR